jgi:methyl-accepting chemotaxis protein
VIGGIGYHNSRESVKTLQNLYQDNIMAAVQLSNAQNSLWKLRYGFPQFMVGDDAAKAKIVEEEPKLVKEIEQSLKAYESGSRTDEEKKALGELKEVFAKYVQARPKWFELQGAGKIEEAAAWRAQTTTPFGGGTVKGFTNQIELQKKISENQVKKSVAEANSDQIIMLVTLVIALISSLILALVISGSIISPIKRVVHILHDIASGEGNLTSRIDIKSNDEMGELARYFNQFIEKLQGIISNVAQNTTLVSSAAKHLMATADKIATGAEKVAVQASTVATAGEEMSSTSGEIAQSCQMAAEGSNHASSAANAGADVVEGTVRVMAQIASRVQATAKTVESLGSRSDQIGDIVATIQDIADQTNLLALNAAIEAARAGEQGRGFAVVADEVRALAERTTKATREISEMIKAIQTETKGAVTAMEEGVREVETGTAEAGKSGQALHEILEQVNAVTLQIRQVATAAEQQTATTSEISSNIYQITEVVQETARGAQESASAAGQLARTAEELQRLVGQFKL